jgi:dolichyl-diphosphooligosaccharide--protein glycosyltransferase
MYLWYQRCVFLQVPGVTLDSSLWEEVFTSKYGKVRIYKVKDVSQTSRAWLADPANKLCDAPGSWYCPGQYPPAIWPVLPAHYLQK